MGYKAHNINNNNTEPQITTKTIGHGRVFDVVPTFVIFRTREQTILAVVKLLVYSKNNYTNAYFVMVIWRQCLCCAV